MSNVDSTSDDVERFEFGNVVFVHFGDHPANRSSQKKQERGDFTDQDFRDLMNAVAQELLGKPNRKMSSGKTMRYGTRGSLSVDLKAGTWYDHENQVGGGALDLIMREKGLTSRVDAVRWMWDNRFTPSVGGSSRSKKSKSEEEKPKKRIHGDSFPGLGKPAVTYDYVDATGELVFQVCRFEPKTFRPRQPDGNGSWFWDLPDADRLVVYRLPAITEAIAAGRPIIVTEGERDCETAVAMGLAATTNQGGCGGGWRDQYNETFRDADVIVIPHHDVANPDVKKRDAGLRHANKIAASLSGIAKRVRVLKLWESWPECPKDGGDLTDWVTKGNGTREQLDKLVDALPNFEPSELPPDETVTPIDLWGHLNPPELPHGLLPEVIERFALVQGGLMGVDPGGLAVAALVVCAAAITDDIELQVKKHDRGWTESARLWAALVGLPSTKKTPILREAVRPLTRIDAAYAREYAAAKQRYDALPQDQRRLVTKPVRRQLKLEDTSIEAAQEVLRDNPSGVLCLADELSGWFGSMDKYNSGRGAAKDRGFWLQAWNGGMYSVNRVTRDCYLIQNLSVSVLGGIQPDLIRKMIDEAHDDGLIQRLLPIVVRAGTEGQDTPAHDVVEAYAHLIESLHKLQPTFAAGWDNPAGLADRLEFDDDAQAIRRRLEKKHLEVIGLEVINRKLAAHVGKYDSFFTRLCVVFHCIEHVSANEPAQASMFAPEHPHERAPLKNLPCTITAATAERTARFLHEFLLRHAAAFYAGVLDLSDDHDRLAAVAGYILAHKLERVTNRDVARGDRTMRRLKKRDTEEVFEQLGALGWLFPESAPRPTDPRHWRVNPEVHRLFSERAGWEAQRRAEVRDLLTRLVG
jgi:hypothetical protein